MKNLHAALKTSFNLTLFSLNSLSWWIRTPKCYFSLYWPVYYILESTYRIIPVLQVIVGPVVWCDMLMIPVVYTKNKSVTKRQKNSGKFELLGILGTFKMAEHSYPTSLQSKPFSLSSFYIVQTSRSWGQHLCSKFAKIPHVGCVDVQSPYLIPWSPPLGHNIDSCIREFISFLLFSGY